jgi:hypothetical protein
MPTEMNMTMMFPGRGAGKSHYRNQVLSIDGLLQEWQEETDIIMSLKRIAHDLDPECHCDTCTSVAAIKLQYK